MEDRIREQFVLAGQFAQPLALCDINQLEPPRLGECVSLAFCCCFVPGDADGVCIDNPYVDFSGARCVGEVLCGARYVQRDGVEDKALLRRQAAVTSPGSEPFG